jgi:hypothetical protein
VIYRPYANLAKLARIVFFNFADAVNSILSRASSSEDCIRARKMAETTKSEKEELSLRRQPAFA